MSEPAPETVKNVIVDSLNQAPIADGQFNEIYTIKLRNGMLDDYLLRVRGAGGGARYLKENLSSTTALTPPHLAALTVPDFLFTGPNVSQSLLHLCTHDDDSPVLEIIPRHKGTPLFKYILGDNLQNDASTKKAKRIELMKELSRPESHELEKLVTQAAFIATQRSSNKFLDINDGSIIVEKANDGHLILHLVDIVGQETIDRDGLRNFGRQPEYQPPQRTWKEKLAFKKAKPQPPHPSLDEWMDNKWKTASENKMMMYLAADQRPVFQGIAVFLSTYLSEGISENSHEEEIATIFRKKLGSALKSVIEKWETGALANEWKGFQRITKPEGHTSGIPDPAQMTPAKFYSEQDIAEGKIKARQISAVMLTEPPVVLKQTLDKLKTLAIANR